MSRDEIAFEIFKMTVETDMNTLSEQKDFCYKVADFILDNFKTSKKIVAKVSSWGIEITQDGKYRTFEWQCPIRKDTLRIDENLLGRTDKTICKCGLEWNLNFNATAIED